MPSAMLWAGSESSSTVNRRRGIEISYICDSLVLYHHHYHVPCNLKASKGARHNQKAQPATDVELVKAPDLLRLESKLSSSGTDKGEPDDAD
ncbi:unnamed protein product [Cochlearia groenlandica]